MRQLLLYGFSGTVNAATTCGLYVLLVNFVDHRVAIAIAQRSTAYGRLAPPPGPR
jgi:putative flippase GtrA